MATTNNMEHMGVSEIRHTNPMAFFVRDGAPQLQIG